MFTRKVITLSAASIGRSLAAQVKNRPSLLMAAPLYGLLLLSSARGDDGTGVLRISDPPAAAASPATPAPEPTSVGRVGLGHGETCDCDSSCGCLGHCGIWHTCLGSPDHGYGCRFLDWHAYNMAYPVNPWYYDPRDTRVYAASGFGAPVTIPLAPTVQTQVNYSWGIPASRITPISRVAPQSGVLMGATAPFPYTAVGPAAPLPPVMPNTFAPR
jgi:hypothetical protein